MTLDEFLQKLEQNPEQIEFNETMDVIDDNYDFTPAKFSNGDTLNEENQNNGSCKIFAFGLLNSLNEQQTLACFGSYYRDDVLAHPENNDHQNIRNFIKSGWDGIHFSSAALLEK
ncbi:MAG: HopJ type III effector protein [Gammaproteobacteria bacterium]|nr:HopJ type III effector protein [Gammaproteobacteria bacterium]